LAPAETLILSQGTLGRGGPVEGEPAANKGGGCGETQH
jgi:hypothetical protein